MTTRAPVVLLAVTVSLPSLAIADPLISKDAAGRIRVTPYPVSAAFQNNAWSPAQENDFAARVTAVIDAVGSNTNYGTPFFESEKAAYPKAMLGYIWGVANNNTTVRTAARNFLTSNATADTGSVGGSQNTDLVDLYPSFTIKAQVSKYFYFGKWSGQQLGTTSGYLYKLYPPNATGDDAAWANKTYLERMVSAAFKWTQDGWTQPVVTVSTGGYTPANSGVSFADPLYRPNFYWQRPLNPGEENWTVQVRNSWVDIRDTDNLKAMRDIGAFLLAHEAGNVNVRNLYAQRYQDAAVAIYRTGISEWDSANYLGWGIAPHLSMYDYAPETLNGGKVKKLAKANVDFELVAGGLKYYRGGFIAPSARDYGGTAVANGNDTAKMLSLYFGQTYAGGTLVTNPAAPQTSIMVHQALSAYRPPQAVVGLAQKAFTRRIEILGTKPTYANWNSPEIGAPRYFETLFFGDTFHLGSVVAPDSAGDYHAGPWNVGTFRLAAFNTVRGVDGFAANTTAVNGAGVKNLGDQIAQYRQLAIWLRPADGKTFYFMAPDATKTAVNGGTGQMTVDTGVYFFQLEKTWIALRPINLTYDSVATANGTGNNVNERQYQFTAASASGTYSGFAIEVGELGLGSGQFASFAAFKAAVLAAALDLSQLASGVVRLNGTDGAFVKIAYNAVNDLPGLYRNSSTPYDFASADNFALYRAINQAPTATLTGVTGGQTVATGVPLPLGALAADTGTRGPLAAGWKTGQLTVLANGYLFAQQVSPSGDVTWSERLALPTDHLGAVNRVEFYVDGVLIGSDDDGSNGWGTSWTPAAGAHSVRARAIDNDNEVGWSAPVAVTAAP